MKTAIYVEDGAVQVVLTPETDFEKSSFKLISGSPKLARIFEGTFYDCRGGWTRQSRYSPPSPYDSAYSRTKEDESLIIRVDDETKPAGSEELRNAADHSDIRDIKRDVIEIADRVEKSGG